MSSFDELYESIKDIDESDYMNEITTRVRKFCNDYGAEANGVLMSFFIKSIAADGVLAEKEYELIKPFIIELANEAPTYEEAKVRFEKNILAATDDEAFKPAIAAFNKLDEKARDDLAIICMMICSIDDELEAHELFWLADILE